MLVTGIWTGTVSHAQVLEKRYRYVLLPGDKLDVKFRLTPEFNQTATVQPDGFIQLDIAGEVKVASLTVEDAEKSDQPRAPQSDSTTPRFQSLFSFSKSPIS